MNKWIILIIIPVLLTLSTFVIPVIPCKTWVSGAPGVIGTFPKNSFCTIFHWSDFRDTYFYSTKNPYFAAAITFLIFLMIVFATNFIIGKLWSRK